MKRVLRLTALVSAVLLCLPLHGQYLDQYTHTVNHTPSVESFQMTRYGNQAPALYTGAMETSLDLSPTGTGLTFEFTIDTEDGTYEHTKSFLYSTLMKPMLP